MNRPQRRGRTAKRASSATKQFDQAWRQWVRPYPPIAQYSVDEVEAIHLASLKILRDIGIKVLSEEARALYVSAGMSQDNEIIRFDPAALMDLIAIAPSKVTLLGRGTGREVVIGGNNIGICTTGGTPNFSD